MRGWPALGLEVHTPAEPHAKPTGHLQCAVPEGDAHSATNTEIGAAAGATGWGAGLSGALAAGSVNLGVNSVMPVSLGGLWPGP